MAGFGYRVRIEPSQANYLLWRYLWRRSTVLATLLIYMWNYELLAEMVGFNPAPGAASQEA
jgi:hypothetical protein